MVKYKGGKRRRGRRVSKRFKRAIRRVAISDAQVRFKTHAFNITSITGISTIADNATLATREGTAATTGWVSRPLDDIGGISIGTAFDTRESSKILLLGITAKFELRPHEVSATNGVTNQWWCRLVWGLWHPDAAASGGNIDTHAITPPDGGGGTVYSNAALLPWPVNSQVAEYEKRAKYHVVGSKALMVGALDTETRYSSGWREQNFSINWKIGRVIDFGDNATNPHAKNIPFMYMYAADGDQAGGTPPASGGGNNGPVLSGEYRVYWKNIN